MHPILAKPISHAAYDSLKFRQTAPEMRNDEGDDIVPLNTFDFYVNNPDQLQALMEQQGVQNIDYVDPTGPLGGGTADNNWKGYIYWLDGTNTEVQIKGNATRDFPPVSYRESLYYSRVTETFRDDVNTPYSYTAVADLSNGYGLFVNEFMVGYSSLQDVYNSYFAGDLDTIGFTGFDPISDNYDVMAMLAHYSASHWEDEWLKTQFYLKGYDWFSGGNMTQGEIDYGNNKKLVQGFWTYMQKNTLISIPQQLNDVMAKIF